MSPRDNTMQEPSAKESEAMTTTKPKLFGTAQDQVRLLEGRHDAEAAKEPAKLTPSAAGQAHLAESTDALAASREALRRAVLAHAREVGETDQARHHTDAAVSDALATYEVIRAQAKERLLNLLPAQRRALSVQELELRERAYLRILGHNPSDIGRQSPEKQITLLTEVTEAVSQDTYLSALNVHQALSDSLSFASVEQHGLSRERTEDKGAMSDLVAARVAFDRAATAHSDLVRSLLTRQDRLAELGQFLKAQDPAYAARRRAQQPIEDEPDAATLSADLAAPASSPASIP